MALVTPDELKVALGVGDLYTEDVLQEFCDAADALIKDIVTAASYNAEPAAMRKAAVSLAVDMFQGERAPGGSPVGVDFQPSPFRFGRSLTSKVTGLLAPYLEIEGLIG
jgi:hypothetical protein